MSFFKLNFDKFPFATKVPFMEAILEEGDCLYVPAYYYIQSRTLDPSTNEPSVDP